MSELSDLQQHNQRIKAGWAAPIRLCVGRYVPVVDR